MSRLFTLLLVSLLLSVGLWYGCSSDDVVLPKAQPIEGDDGARLFAWGIGPIDGITTVWHATPDEITVPVGTTVRLKCADSQAGLQWSNVANVQKAEGGSIATIRVERAGTIEITVDAPSTESGGDGRKEPGARSSSTLHRCIITGVNTAAKDIGVRDLVVTASPLEMSDYPSNEETMHVFFEGGVRYQALSRVREVQPGHFVSALNRIVTATATADDARFSSLIEVRVPGYRPSLVKSVPVFLSTIGKFAIDAGPPANSRSVTVETYSVSIASHVSFQDRVDDNRRVTFTAVTNPPGFEPYITWLSSTKYGSANPILGNGSSFDVTFYSTYGIDEETPGRIYQWLGVRADNTTFNQDLKVSPTKLFSVYPPGPFGKAPATGLPDLSLHLQVHCPATSSCTPSPPSMAPAYDRSNMICEALASCTSADASVMATDFATGLSAGGCPAVASASGVGNGVWDVSVVLPQQCMNSVVCTLSWSAIEVNQCLPGLTPSNPLHNLCYGGTGDERAAWVGGWSIR